MKIGLITLLATVMSVGVSAQVPVSKVPTGPIGKVKPNKNPSLKIGPLNLPATQFAKSIQDVHGKSVLNVDGSYDIGTQVIAILSTPAGPGVAQATSLRVDRIDDITCQGGVAPVMYKPLFPAPYVGVLQGGAFVASVPISMDLFFLEAKCAVGQPDSATITLTSTATTNAGGTVTDTLVMHMYHFNN